VKGVDYKFYRELLAGKYDAEVNAGSPRSAQPQRYRPLARALTKA
jgi:hypothetical protein